MAAAPLFTRAIVRKPCPEIIHGLTTANLGEPDYETALAQHDRYIRALESCGIAVTVLDANPAFPDSTFVEDTAVLTPHGAVVTRPGAPSRREEIRDMEVVLKKFFTQIEYIRDPGTLEGGDVMQVESHYFIGLSGRTNTEGAHQLKRILRSWGYSASVVSTRDVLHLKSEVSWIGEGRLLATGKFAEKEDFQRLTILRVPEEESYAANSILVNNRVLIPSGFSQTRLLLEEAGCRLIELEVSEFRKLDGGLSCLSLRF